MRLRLCGSNGTLPALAASLHTQERAHHTQERILLTEAHPSTAVGPLWSPSTLLRCAAERMRNASGLGEAAAKLLGCAILLCEVYSCKEIVLVQSTTSHADTSQEATVTSRTNAVAVPASHGSTRRRALRHTHPCSGRSSFTLLVHESSG